MFDYNIELALKELFMFQNVLADAIDTYDMFALLCEIYCVGEIERNEIVGLLGDKKLNEIHTVNDYYRQSRLKQYYQNFCGGYVVDDERIEELIAIKGAALEKAQADKLLSAYEKSCGRAYDEIVRLASEGTVSAKRLLGILQMTGIYITQDVSVGLENLRDAADWLDIQALVTAIYYDETDRREFLDKLYSVTQKTEYAVIVEQLQIKYGIENCAAAELAKMLEKAFIIGTAKRDVCSSQHLRVLRSNVLSEKDKRTVLLSGNKELIPAVCGLPLRQEYRKIEINNRPHAVLDRVEETASVMRALENNDLRNREFFRSLCICSNSEYVRNAYADLIFNVFSENNVVQIDVSSLSPIDLDASENNVFVRNCREKENNVYIIRLSGKIDERIVGLFRMFAMCSCRKTFAVSRLGVSIDLSAVLPVFICDGKNAQLLDSCVGVVKAADIAESEKSLVLSELLNKKRAAFSADEITVEDGARDILLDLPVSKIGGVLDRAILSQRKNNEQIYLSTDIIKMHITEKKTNIIYGFGGNNAKK